MKKKVALVAALLLQTQIYGDEFSENFSAVEKDENVVQLEETVISVSGFETSIRNTPNNISIITSEEIEDKNYNSVEDALSDLPSVRINQGVFGSSVDLRGQGNSTKAKNNVQVLVDGVPLNPIDGDHGVLPLNAISIENVESIEVIPDGGSILYGGGTAGGVINIITKTGTGYEPVNSVKYERGSYGRNTIDVSAGYKVNEKLLFQGTYSGNDEDNYREDITNDSDFYSILGKYQITDNQEITLKYSRYEEDIDGASDYLTRDQVDEDREQLGNEDVYEGEVTRDEVLVKYKYDVNDSWMISTDMAYQKTENDTYQEDSMSNENVNFEDKKYTVRPKVQYTYVNDSKLVMGFDYINSSNERDYEYEYPMFGLVGHSLYEFDKDTYGAYLLNTYKVGKFELTQGYRYERSDYDTKKTTSGVTDYDDSTDEGNSAYELAVNYLYSDTGNVYVRWERGFTSPAANQLIDKYGTGDYRINDLDSEKHTTYELGVKDHIFGSYVSATAFYTEKDDEIYNDMNGTSSWYYENIDETTRYGIELSAEQKLGKFAFKESYTYIDAEISSGENDGNGIPNVSKHSFVMDVAYRYNEKLSAIWTTEYRDSYYINEENEGGEVNSYITHDIIVNYEVGNGLKLYGGVRNIFDNDYYNDVDYEDGRHTYDPAEERNYYAGFKYTL